MKNTITIKNKRVREGKEELRESKWIKSGMCNLWYQFIIYRPPKLPDSCVSLLLTCEMSSFPFGPR